MVDVTKHDKNRQSDGSDDFKTNVNGDRWIGAFEAFGEVFGRILKNPQPLVLMLVAYVALTIMSTFTDVMKGLPYGRYYNLASPLGLVFLLAVPTYALALADGKRITIGEFMRFDVRKYLVILGASIISFVAVFASLALLVFPAIWMLAWLFLVSYATVDKGYGVVDSIKESYRLARDNKGKVWGIIGTLVLVMFSANIVTSIISAILFAKSPNTAQAVIQVISVIVAVVVTVIGGGASAMLYRWLQRNVPASEQQKATSAAPVE